MQVSNNFTRLLDKRLTKVYENKLPTVRNMRQNFYNMMGSDSAFQEFFEVGSLPDIPEFNGKLTELSIAPGFYNKIEPKEWGAYLSFERKLLEDKKYPVFDSRTEEMAVATQRTMEKLAARGFTNAFSAAFDFQVSEEGVALCSTSHTTKSGVSTATGFSNYGTSPISKTSIIATRLAMKRFRNDIAELVEMEPDLLIVPESQYDAACEAVGYDPRSGATSDLDPNSGQFKVNAARGISVMPYIRLDDVDTKSWFMVDQAKMKKFNVWIDRARPEFESRYDFYTRAVETSVYFRIGYGFLAWQWIYGNQVS